MADEDDALAELLEPLKLSDDETLETLAVKQSAQLGKLSKYFTGKMEGIESAAVEKAQAPTKAKEAQAIKDFSKTHLGMQDAKVVAMMQPLYDEGNSLEESYAIACRGREVDPELGKPIADLTDEEKAGKKDANEDKDDADKGDKPKPKTSSARLDTTLDDTGDDADNDKDDDKPLTIEDAIDANMNDYIAKHGDPFTD